MYSSSDSHIKTAHLIIDIISTNTVSVHEVGSPLTCTGATFGNIRIMLRTPVVTKLMCSDKISLSCYNSLSIKNSTRAQATVQVQSVTILEVLCNITKLLRQAATFCIFSTKYNSNLSHFLHCVWASLREYNTHNSIKNKFQSPPIKKLCTHDAVMLMVFMCKRKYCFFIFYYFLCNVQVPFFLNI
jgi:hypothetical protein